MVKKVKKDLINWFMQPSSWLSIVAMIISVMTFFLIYTYKGKLEIVLPDKIGITNKNGELRVMVPIVFTNTGAPRTLKHITSINAELIFPSIANSRQDSIEITWLFEGSFISATQYREKYPNSNADLAQDMLEYNSRAFPFSIFGGTSIQKTYVLSKDFNLSKDDILNYYFHPPFTLELYVETEEKCFSSKGFYGKEEDNFILEDFYKWILRNKIK